MTRWVPRLESLHAKLLWGTLLVISLSMATVFLIIEHHLRVAIIGEVERRGEVLARNLGAISQGPLLLYNFTALEQNVARVATEVDVVYAMVLDADGRIAAHSRRPERVGLVLEDAVDRRAAETNTPLTQHTLGDVDEPVYDFAVPVIVERQRWGTVRVGLAKRRMEAEIWRTRLELAAVAVATLLLGGLATAVVARRISRPVRALAEGAQAISRGELNLRIEPESLDEIGRLAAAFNHMATELREQRTALEDANAELRRRFEELADLKTYTDSILASLQSGLVTVDLDGRVVTLNPSAELMTGFFAAEVAGRYCTEVFAGTPGVGEILMDTLATRTASPGVAVTLRRRNGRAVPVEVSAAPLKGVEGKDLGVILVLRDLTVVRELEHRLQRSDRLAALGELAAGLAHEIKNPLTSVLTFSRHLGRRFDDEQFRERFQAVVPRELERINTIVERLLELSRPARLEFKPVRLPGLLERVVDLHGNEIDAKEIRVAREYARDLPVIWADAEALYQAFVNIVRNALDAMGARGRLTLRCGWHEPADNPLGHRRPRSVRVEVEDTGGGIAAADSERVFNPFYSTKDGGTGLGLALTHKIVEDHGGAIDFRSTPGAGTTFRVVLPLVPEPPANPAGYDDDRR
jgi:two-component system sensor histidine kinase AtoS